MSSQNRHRGSSSSCCKEFLRAFVDHTILITELEDWFSGSSEELGYRKPVFDAPFEFNEIQNLDYALEGVSFQQLVRMPNSEHASNSDAIEDTAYLAIEDFLHSGVKGLWDTFWDPEKAMPLSVACVHSTSSKFYPAEKSIARGKLDDVCATAIMFKSPHHTHGKWDRVILLTLLRPRIGNGLMQNERNPSLNILGEALFFALRLLLTRRLSRSSKNVQTSNCVYILPVDSQFGMVVKVEGDINRLEFDINNAYECAAKWVERDAKISVSPIDRIWNKLGSANWGDIGTLQLLLAVFHSMVQFCGQPKFSLDDLAAAHSSRLQTRLSEWHLADKHVNGNGLFRYQQQSQSCEIVEVQEETAEIIQEEASRLEIGSTVWIEDAHQQKGFKVDDTVIEGESPIYIVSPVDEPGKAHFLYVGSSPSHLETAWEGMSSWFQVQRQTRVLTLMSQRGLSSKYLPQMVASGRRRHPGQCQSTSSGNCSHPCCGAPVLVTTPVGESITSLIQKGLFGLEDALKCCHDCLSALSAASSAGVKHGDIRPENVIRVEDCSRSPYFVLVGWGHAAIEDRDRVLMNLFFSSTYALQEGKLCSASDAESLIYLLYYSCGGVSPELDSVEGTLEWRETSWSRRVIQQKLGDVSAVLKAFADYVDSLCGTPYPIDYKIWLRRLRRTLKEDFGKDIDDSD